MPIKVDKKKLYSLSNFDFGKKQKLENSEKQMEKWIEDFTNQID